MKEDVDAARLAGAKPNRRGDMKKVFALGRLEANIISYDGGNEY